MKKIKIAYGDDFICILKGNKELCYWHIDEWTEDPQVAFSIFHAIELATTDPDKLITLHNRFYTCDDCKKCGETICGNDTKNMNCFEAR
jgi:hypothetical protein